VLGTPDGNEAVRVAYAERPDLILLDVMLPGLSGLEVCRAVRRELTMPILMLTARDEEIDKVLGLEIGADDYMTKPFSLRELMARVHALLRRTAMLKEHQPVNGKTGSEAHEPHIVLGDITIDPAARQVLSNGEPVNLKPKEFDLLLFLARHPNRVFTREALLDRVWGYEFVGGTRTVDVHIRWLRSKVEKDPANPVYLQTVFGVGYKLIPQNVPAIAEDDRP